MTMLQSEVCMKTILSSLPMKVSDINYWVGGKVMLVSLESTRKLLSRVAKHCSISDWSTAGLLFASLILTFWEIIKAT